MNAHAWRSSLVILLFTSSCFLDHSVQAEPKPRDLNTPREFPAIASRSQWEIRADHIREQVLVSCGLWPMPNRTAIQPHIFDRVERDGYSVEKVYFETLPGFYLAGNLYRPLGRGRGPFPGILNPHGHWKDGRFADTADGSIAARCISFARQGMVAFSYDMVGFNDTHFSDTSTNKPFYDRHRAFGTNRSDQLWNIGSMGLQTWDSIRALDFLESLPDVDRKQLACTGESGGGTQTFILGAIDDRLAVQAPVVMVSHTMQGGCSCENAPGLRIEYSNMEIAAAAAPRPQIIVGASGDWTKDTMTVEGPAVQGIYHLFNADDKLRFVRFDFGHNYNQTSREAVYEWFGKFIGPSKQGGPIKELAYKKEPEAGLRVFPEGTLPRNAASQDQIITQLKKSQYHRWQSLLPDSRAGLKKYKDIFFPGWRHTLQAEWPQRGVQTRLDSVTNSPHGFSSATLQVISSDGATNSARYYAPTGLATNRHPRLAILDAATKSTSSVREDFLTPLLRRGLAVVVLNPAPAENPSVDQTPIFYTAYNRTRCQERVRELLAFCAAAGAADLGNSQPFHVILVGTGRAGLSTLLAAPGANAVIADVDEFDVADDELMVQPGVFCPGIRNIGDFEGTALLAAPNPLCIHNTGRQFPYETLRNVYKKIGARSAFQVETTRLTPERLALMASQM